MNYSTTFGKSKVKENYKQGIPSLNSLKGVQNVLFPIHFSILNRARTEGYLSGTPVSLFPKRYRCDNNTGISPERMDNNGRFHFHLLSGGRLSPPRKGIYTSTYSTIIYPLPGSGQ